MYINSPGEFSLLTSYETKKVFYSIYIEQIFMYFFLQIPYLQIEYLLSICYLFVIYFFSLLFEFFLLLHVVYEK